MMNSAYVEYHSPDLVHLCRERPCTGTERVQGEILEGCVWNCAARTATWVISGTYRQRVSRQARFPEAGTVWRSITSTSSMPGKRRAAKSKSQPLSSLSSPPSGAFTQFCEIVSICSNLQRLDVSYVRTAESAQNFQDELSVTGGTARATTSNGSEQHDSTHMTVLYGVKTFEGDANARRGMTWDLGWGIYCEPLARNYRS